MMTLMEDDKSDQVGYSDLQLSEAYNIMRDLIFLYQTKH